MKPNQTTVLIPAFNEERFIRQCLESVVNQVDCVLIGDNASTDGTAAICREYADKYKHIRYIRNETNIGSVQNTVSLANLVDTEFIMQMGAHDKLPDDYVSTLRNLLNANQNAVCVYGNCSYLECDDTISKTTDFVPVRAGMIDDNPYIRGASFFHGNQPYNLIFGLFRSVSAIPIFLELKPIAGCDHFLVVAALLEGKFLYTPETAYLRRMLHPGDTDKDYMTRIAGDNSSKKISRDYTAVGMQMHDWVREHYGNQKELSPSLEKAFKELLFQMALKFDTPTTHPFWNSVFFLRRHWRKGCKYLKCMFVPGYAERKNL
jgi:glycosyltransferase involved in cell wall biosynthesis